MHVKNVKIQSNRYEEIKSVLVEFDEPKNEIVFDNGSQLSYEKHSFLNQNNYVLTILIIKHPSETNISFICGGASTGLFFKFDWGSEISAIDKIFSEVELFCQSQEIEYEILDDNDAD